MSNTVNDFNLKVAKLIKELSPEEIVEVLDSPKSFINRPMRISPAAGARISPASQSRVSPAAQARVSPSAEARVSPSAEARVSPAAETRSK